MIVQIVVLIKWDNVHSILAKCLNQHSCSAKASSLLSRSSQKKLRFNLSPKYSFQQRPLVNCQMKHSIGEIWLLFCWILVIPRLVFLLFFICTCMCLCWVRVGLSNNFKVILPSIHLAPSNYLTCPFYIILLSGPLQCTLEKSSLFHTQFIQFG